MRDRDRPCAEARDVAFEHLTDIRRKLAELRELERSVAAFVQDCDQMCAGGVGADCVILEELAAAPASPASRCCARGSK